MLKRSQEITKHTESCKSASWMKNGPCGLFCILYDNFWYFRILLNFSEKFEFTLLEFKNKLSVFYMR